MSSSFGQGNGNVGSSGLNYESPRYTGGYAGGNVGSNNISMQSGAGYGTTYGGTSHMGATKVNFGNQHYVPSNEGVNQTYVAPNNYSTTYNVPEVTPIYNNPVEIISYPVRE